MAGEYAWPESFVDPFLSGPAVLPTDLPEVRALVEAGLPADERGAA